MSAGIIETMRRIAEAEVRKVHLAELGVVTSVFPHSSDGDKDNYECNVRLKDVGAELRRVPVATPHVGLVDIPHVGDLVLLSFIGGDVNSPVIIGRLYNDEDRPPTSSEEELVYRPPYSKNASLRRVHLHLPGEEVEVTVQDDQVLLKVGGSKVTVDKGGITIDTQADIKMKSAGSLSIQAKSIKMVSDQETQLTATSRMTIKGGTVDINP